MSLWRNVIQCLRLHVRLSVPVTEADPLSFLLNKIPRTPRSSSTIKKWERLWPIITNLLLVLEILHHPDHTDHPLPDPDPFLFWLTHPPTI
ncbi:hypothetical protein [Absidia glauca]|uniref:Uncharacterized protein n=1 Tax=Absidia glauca TaxID=4829 RepID=A0A163JDB0_ABSGL|nr:hypothetical protein [Absidia glauca]